MHNTDKSGPVDNRPRDRQYRSSEESSEAVSQCGQPTPMRMPARDVIYHHVERLRRQANQLEALARAIPQDITHEADEALHELLCCVW